MNSKVYLQDLARRMTEFVGHRNCFVCHQSSRVLVCEPCLSEAVLPLFPMPGHNLLDYKKVANNLVTPAYESLIVLGKYEGILKGLINQLKFSGKTLAAEVLATYFCHYLGGRLFVKQDIPEVLVPIPLSSLRHINRQFNQSRLISTALASKLKIKSVDILKRCRHTKQQSQLNKQDRQHNVENVFAVREHHNVNSIAIIDDVITTGATVNAAALAIQKHFPNTNIQVWCMAATMR